MESPVYCVGLRLGVQLSACCFLRMPVCNRQRTGPDRLVRPGLAGKPGPPEAVTVSGPSRTPY